MKLLVFCPYYPPHVGGLETHAAEFNKYMIKNKVAESIVVFTAAAPPSAPPLDTSQPKITIIRFPAWHIIPNYPVPKFWHWRFWQQWQQLSRLECDLVISRTRFFFTSVLALVVAKTRHKAWVHIEHGSDYVQLSNRVFSCLAYWYDRTIGWMILHVSTQNIAISEAVRLFIAQFDHRLVPVVYRGVEIDVIEKVAPNAQLITQFGPKKILIFVGRLIDGKGVADLIQAITVLPTQTIMLLIVGDGPQRPHLEKLVKTLKLESYVTFLGQTPLPEAIALVKAADIFINPSYTEGLPSSVIEAALCQRCIIATDVGGTREIITDGESGLLVPPRQPDRLAQALNLALADAPLRQRLGHQAAKTARKRFSWRQSCDTYRDIFLQVLASSR